MVHSPDGDTGFFNIVAGVLQVDTLVPYLFIVCLYNILWTSVDLIKENGFTLKKAKTDDILQKLWQTQTTQMIRHFLLMHQSQQNSCCIAYSKQQVALGSK